MHHLKWTVALTALAVTLAAAGCAKPQASMGTARLQGGSAHQAGRTVAERAMDAVKGEPKLLIVYTWFDDADPQVIAGAAEAGRRRGAAVVGVAAHRQHAVSAGVGDEAQTVSAVALGGRSLRAEVLAVPDAMDDFRGAAARIANTLARPDSKALILLGDPATSHSQQVDIYTLLTELNRRMPGLPIVGGQGSPSGDLPAIYVNDQPVERGLAAIMLSGEIAVGLASTHNYEVVAGPFAVTEVAPPRTLLTVDGRNVVDVYTEALGVEAGSYDELRPLMGDNPVGYERDGEVWIRYPWPTEDGRAFRNFVTPWRVGDRMYVLTYDADQYLPSARASAAEASAEMTARGTVVEQTICYSGRLVDVEHRPEPVGAMGFYCIGRSSRGDDPGGEVAAITAGVGQDVPVGVVYCSGEICTFDAHTDRAETGYFQLSACTLVIGVPTK